MNPFLITLGILGVAAASSVAAVMPLLGRLTELEDDIEGIHE